MIDRIENATRALLDWAALSLGRQVLLITILSALVLVPGLAEMPVTDRDEARFAQASKQMLETGDLIDIRFQDAPRWKKPVGIYWLQAASASLFGGVEAPIWAYRIPSAIAAWLAALLTLWAARPLIGARGALVSGAMIATTLLMVAEGHIAKTDAALTASAAGALGGLAHIFFGRGGWGAALVFWLSLAASILLKGPIVPAIVIFALAALWWRKETRPGFARLRILPGLALTVALVAPWLVAIWEISDGKFFEESLGKDMAAKVAAGQEKHWGPPGLYLALVWVTFWPWAALIPLAAGWVWSQRSAAWGLFLLAWLIPFWIVLEAVPTKLPHYVLPLYPVLAILVGAALVAGADPARRRWRWVAAFLAVVPAVLIAIALVLGTVFLIWSGQIGPGDGQQLENTEPPWIAAALVMLAASFAIIGAKAILRGQLMAYLGTGVMAAALVFMALLQFGIPQVGFAFPSPAIAEALKRYQACASGPAYSVGYHEPSLVFLTETGIRMADPKAAMAALADDPGARVLITARWQKIVKDIPPSVRREVFHYFNYNRGKWETATLLTQDDPRWDACVK